LFLIKQKKENEALVEESKKLQDITLKISKASDELRQKERD
jgi:hypothetical protein